MTAVAAFSRGEALVKLVVREAAAAKLRHLSEESAAAANSSPVSSSWVNGASRIPAADDDDDGVDRRSTQCRFLDYAGFLHLPAFVGAATCRAMRDEMTVLVENEWHPEQEQRLLDSFGTDAQQNVQRGDYFLESADKVHYFAEPDALEGGKLKPIYCHTNKVCALNKAGHALHLLPNSIFREYTLSERLRAAVLDWGWKDPVVPQSMYIFKQAVTGGAVNSHQDSTFLYTTPRQSCLGLWLAVDDATLENGCLWVRPRSHVSEGTRRQYMRNVRHFGEASIAARSNEAIDPSQPTFEMKELIADENVPWDGGLPGDGDWEALLEAGFIPIECKAGDLLAFCGELDHLSLPNTSDSPRHTFQLHLVEGPSQGVEWSPYNWLQYPNGKPFLRLLGD